VSFGTLALVVGAGLLGPVLAWRWAWHVPDVLGVLLAGILLGRSGLRWLDATDPTFSFLADVGFALVMFVAGSHVPVADPTLRAGVRVGAARAAAVGVVAALLGTAVAAVLHNGHAGLYAVLMASSSAALVLPIVDSLDLGGPAVLQLLPQVAIADAACIVALPLVIDPAHAARAALGAMVVVACAALLYLVLRRYDQSGARRRLHHVSEVRRFALELRLQLVVLSALGALAIRLHVSILLAGFSFGLVVAAIGVPRRLARQLFALTEGFLGPVFFVWLGAAMDLRELSGHPAYLLLGLVLGLGAVLAHLAVRALGQPAPLAVLASAQLGVPVAAATLGTQLRLLRPGEAPALVLGALVTIAAAAVVGRAAARSAGAAA